MKIQRLLRELLRKKENQAKANSSVENEISAFDKAREDFDVRRYDGEEWSLGKSAALISPERVKAFVGGISKGIAFNSDPQLVYVDGEQRGASGHLAWLFDVGGKKGSYQMYIDIFPRRSGLYAYNSVGFSNGCFKQVPVEENLKIKDMSSMKRSNVVRSSSLGIDTMDESSFDGELNVYEVREGRLVFWGISKAEYCEHISSIGDECLFRTSAERLVPKNGAGSETKEKKIAEQAFLLRQGRENIR